MYVHAKVQPFLENLLRDARDAGVDIKIISAYRSFDTQATVKSNYSVIYGSGANQFSADQGYSEHQLGTAIDFTTTATGANFSAFEKTPAYQWLLENAHRFGFILSYPKGNDYYLFEPWHWRFVGTSLARMLNVEKLNFYDVDQREIDKYLVNIFD
jgi:D-alanyl-D-alanine carboxypeptidase